jgi:muramoyltetrapeptide carboxypeptidase
MSAKKRMAVHKPARLKPGARIGVVAPAGCVEPDTLERGIEAIRAEGFDVEVGRAVQTRKGYLAGEAAARAEDLLSFFRRADIDAIFCARGGFGSAQLLPYLSPELSGFPKIFVGYSDITILLNWVYQSYGMVTFHGPMVAEDLARGLGEPAKGYFWHLLKGELPTWSVALETPIRPGMAKAEMVGGCLSLLVTTLGTPYEIDTRGKLLFLEDVGEKPYRLERMLIHLKMAGKFDQIAGVIFGDFTRCADDGARDLREIVAELFFAVPYPVVMGMKAGHGEENLTLPIGARMRLDAANATLALLESPVS